MNVLCVYGGSGSMAYAAKKLGHTVIGNIEPRSFERGETFLHNFKHTFFKKDFVNLHSLKNKQIDLLLGHPSCGAFSSFNISTKKNSDEIVNFFEVVKQLQPEFFICDNLEKACKTITPILLQLTNEYNIFPQFIQNLYYGNPQDRKRLYVIGGKKKYHFVPTPNEDKYSITTVSDRIGHLLGMEGKIYGHYEQPDNDNWSRMLHVQGTNKKMTYAEGKEYWKHIKPGKIIQYINPSRELKTRIGLLKVRWDSGPCNTLTGSTPKVHPIRNNNLTVKESLLLMGYGDDFEIPGIKIDENNKHKLNIGYYKKIRKGVCIESIKHFILNIDLYKRPGLKFHSFTGKEYENSDEVNKLKLTLCNKQGAIYCYFCKLKRFCKEFKNENL
jgi:site-specific DNA-cytosine methylase